MMLVGLREESMGYGNRPVLINVSLAVEAGEKIALLGRSGAGKSTLLTQLYLRLAASQPIVALVPQDEALVPALSVYHNIYMGRLDRRSAVANLANLIWPATRDTREVAQFARTVAMDDSLWQTVATLSGGQKQRTAIARALYRGGPIVLADEPVSAVDVTQGSDILIALGQRFETVILAMHDVDLALSFASRVVGLKGGQIVFDGPAHAIARGQILDLYAD
jgi:phosphonate transport system ATP-binding protein